jgi:hypothetical protein
MRFYRLEHVYASEKNIAPLVLVRVLDYVQGGGGLIGRYQ